MKPLPAWITDPALSDAWSRIQDRYEKAGLIANGRVQLAPATREQRHALGSLLGRSITKSTVRIDLGALDQRLRDRSGVGGLREVLTSMYGTAPEDRPAARAKKDAARQIPLERARELVQTRWAATWVDALRRTGLLTGQRDAVQLIEDAAAVLNDLVVPQPRQQSRVELAARLLGDAHALDPDRLLHRVVLRGLAAAAETALPETTSEVAQLWSRFGVEPDLLSRTCLVLGLHGSGGVGERLRLASEARDPLHITEWDLRNLLSLGTTEARSVLICENPRVLEAIAESGHGQAVVCTSGEPNLVVLGVIERLRSGGVPLVYHGDFDWPGIGIANRIRQNFGAEPWFMNVEDYVDAVRVDAPTLGSQIVEPSWDPDLGAAMRRHGRAVHEESVLPQLMERLAEL